MYIDIKRKIIKIDKNREMMYDKFIFVIGLSLYMFFVKGFDKEGVFGFCIIEDC